MSSNNLDSRVLDEFVELEDFARNEVRRHPRTVKRWTKQPDGLPTTYMGRTEMVHLPTAKEWLRNRIKQRNPRREGRSDA